MFITVTLLVIVFGLTIVKIELSERAPEEGEDEEEKINDPLKKALLDGV